MNPFSVISAATAAASNTQSINSSRPAASAPVRTSLLTAEQAAIEVYGVSERTFHNMRAKGWVHTPVVLGPRLLRWHRHELEAAISTLPRQPQPAPEPVQLQRNKRRSTTNQAGA